MATETLDDLLIALGFVYNPEDAQQFREDLDSTIGLAKKFVKGIAAVSAAITSLVTVTTTATDSQGKLADEIGESIETIEALQFALRISGGTAEGMASSLQNLARTAGEAARGVGTGIEAFGILGVSVLKSNGSIKTASELIFEISNRFQNLDRFRQIELAEKLGLSESIRLLQQGPQAIQELITEATALGVATKEDAAVSSKFQDSLTRIWQITKQISRTLTSQFVPFLQNVNDEITEWWKNNRQLIEQRLPEWIDTATEAMKFFVAIMGVFLAAKFVNSVVTLVSLFRGLSFSILAVNAAAFLLPVLIGTVITALGLLIEDAVVFFKGGESFIGDMIEKFPQLENEIRSVLDVFKNLTDLIFKSVDGWKQLVNLIDNFSIAKFKEVLGNIPGFLLDVTGIAPIGSSLNPGITQSSLTRNQTRIDKVEITVDGGAEPANVIAEKTFNIFNQASQNLNSAIDQ